jgi:rubrerythrin
MAITFNADEALKMAVRIEQNGAAFYRKAAEFKKDDGSSDFLIELAEMEDEHEKTFESMRAELADEEKGGNAYDPYDEAALYLGAMADSHGGEGDPGAAEKLTGDEGLDEILNIAIGLEKESILFYTGLKDMVPEHLGKEKLDDIIGEERGHVAILAKKRISLKG